MRGIWTLLFSFIFLTAKAQPDAQRARLDGTRVILGDTSEFPELRRHAAALLETLKKDNNKPNAWFELGTIFFDLTEYEAAISALDQSIKRDSSDYRSYYQRGATYVRLRQYSDAFADYEKAIDLKGDYPWSWLDLGILYNDLSLSRRAISALTKALELQPRWAPAFFELGCAYESLKTIDSAYHYYFAALEADTAMYKAWNNIGNLQLAEHKYTDAVTSFTAALTIWPGYTFALTNRAQARYHLQDTLGACADLDAAIRLGRTDKVNAYRVLCK